MVTITLYTRQQKRHWCIEQSFGLCGRGRGWEDLGEWHWNMYNIIYETSRQSRFDAQYWMLGAGALGRPRGMVWGGRREEGSGWGTCVYLWRIHFDIWQNQYNIVKLKNKIKKKKRNNWTLTAIFALPGSPAWLTEHDLQLFLNLQPAKPPPLNFGLTKSSQLCEPNPQGKYLYICMSQWFCFSGEPWLRQPQSVQILWKVHCLTTIINDKYNSKYSLNAY